MMQALADNSARSLVPFGHATIQDDVLDCPFFYFWRQLACLEMPQRTFDTLPFAHSELVQMVADHRQRTSVDIAVATIGDVKNALDARLDARLGRKTWMQGLDASLGCKACASRGSLRSPREALGRKTGRETHHKNCFCYAQARYATEPA